MPRILIALFAVTAIGLGSAKAQSPKDLDEIKQLTVMLSPELKTAHDGWQTALLLRDQVHRHSVQEAAIAYAGTTELLDSAAVYRMSLLTRERSNLCQGLAILYMLALKAYGIDSRQVQMFATRVAWTTVWSHSSVDVWIDGEWVAMDPTFNTSLRDGAGKRQSWPAALKLAKAGGTVVLLPDGRPVKAQMSWASQRERFGHRLEDLAEHVVLGPSPRTATEVLGEWDGKIEMIAGPVYDAKAGAEHEIFKRLSVKSGPAAHLGKF